MQADIHPKNYTVTVFTCSCGNVINTRSCRGGEVRVDICSNCHPFYTGKSKLMDTAGRIDKFKQKYGEE